MRQRGDLAGRVDEQRLLTEVIQDGGIGLLSGEPGSGKTTLLQWAKTLAEGQGFTVASCQPAALEESISGSALSEFLLGLRPAISGLASHERETLESLTAGRQLLDRAAARQAVTALLADLVRNGPVLVAIDDLQWVDAFSAEVFTYAIRRACLASPVLVAVRGGVLSPMADAMRRSERSTRIPVGAMSERELADVAALELGASTPLCLTIAGLAAGSPLRAREIARLARTDQSLVLNMAHIAAELNPFAARLRGWSTERLLVLFAATHTRQATTSLLQHTFDQDVTAVIFDAERDGLLTVDGDLVLAAHALVPDAVAAALPASDRARLHSRVVEAIEEPVERARHLSLSDAPRSIAVAEQISLGSTQAYKNGLYVLAYQLADRVPGFLPVDANEELARAQLWLAHLEYRQDLDDVATDRLRALLDSAMSERTRTDVLLMLATIEAWSEDAMTGVERFITVFGSDVATPEQRAQAATHLAILSMAAASVTDAYELAAAALELARPAGGQLLAEAEAIFVAASLFAGRGFEADLLDRAIERADIDNPLSLQGPPVQWAPFLWVWAGDDRAEEGFVWRRKALSELGFDAALSLSLSIEARLLLEKGRHREAVTLVSQSRDRCEYESPLTDAMVSVAEARLIAHCGGSADEAHRLLAHAEAILEPAGMGFGLIESATVRMSLLARTDPDATVEFGLQAMDRHFDRGLMEPSLVPGIADLLEAITVTDHERRAEVLHLFDDVAKERPDLVNLRAWRDACVAASSPEPSPVLLSQYADDRAAVGDVFWSARADLAGGRVLRRNARRLDAARHFERAAASFRSIEALPWAELCDAEHARVARRAKARAGELTDAEQRIAALAAAGNSNKEIAGTLFVSTKTVEAVLSSTYRKLGIARRSQLHDALPKAPQSGDSSDLVE